jgi:hypothetical protein
MPFKSGWSSYTPRESASLNILRASLGDDTGTFRTKGKRKRNIPLGLVFTVKKYLHGEPMTLTINAKWYHNVPHHYMHPRASNSRARFTSAQADYFL